MTPSKLSTVFAMLTMVMVMGLWVPEVSQAVMIGHDFWWGASKPHKGSYSKGNSPMVHEEESEKIYAPHHTPGDGFHEEHYFAETGDTDHFAWFSATPAMPGPITVKYDFRAIGAFANVITDAEKARAMDALTAWSAATGGRLSFELDTVAADMDIINIGTGALEALGFTSGVGGILGLGGGVFSHGATTHSITGGVAWQDKDETWDTVIGNGDPTGTFDYFTVVTQEIGHALGLGHTDNVAGADIMDGSYGWEQTVLSAVDVSHITSVYGAAVVPEPSSFLLVALGMLGAAWTATRMKP